VSLRNLVAVTGPSRWQRLLLARARRGCLLLCAACLWQGTWAQVVLFSLAGCVPSSSARLTSRSRSGCLLLGLFCPRCAARMPTLP
jgi:hypothetical protein